MDRNLGNESTAIEGFEEAIQCLQKLKLDSEQASLEQRVAIIDPHYSYSHPRAYTCCSKLTFITYLCSASLFSNSCATSWQISKAWSSPILRMHTHHMSSHGYLWKRFNFTILFSVTYGRSCSRNSARFECVLPPLEAFFVAQNV